MFTCKYVKRTVYTHAHYRYQKQTVHSVLCIVGTSGSAHWFMLGVLFWSIIAGVSDVYQLVCVRVAFKYGGKCKVKSQSVTSGH